MDQPTLQARLDRGDAIAAAHIGTTCAVYRPRDTTNPLAPQNRRPDLAAAFNARDPSFRRPQLYGSSVGYIVADRAALRPGDYLVAPTGTWFIAGQDPLVPMVGVQTNRVLSGARPVSGAAGGSSTYGGVTASTITPLFSNYPASLLANGGGQTGILPADATIPTWTVLLPSFPLSPAGAPLVSLRGADILTDTLGFTYTISSAEQTALGWRIVVSQAST